MSDGIGDAVTRAAQANLGIGQTSTQVSDAFQQQLLAALSNPLFNLPKVFLTYITDYVATSGLNIPFGQVIGALNFAPKSATTIATGETTTSATLADLATVGPTLTGLTPGAQYLVLYACIASSSSTSSNAGMAITLGPLFTSTISAGIIANGASPYSIMGFTLATLPDGCDSLQAKYQSSNGVATASFAVRSLVAIKTANA